MTPDVLCIGAVLWDLVARPDPRVAPLLAPGADLPGRIVRVPGGVALNVAVTLRRFGMRPALLGAVGADAEGDALVARCAALGVATEHLTRTADPTDRFVAIEGPGGALLGAIADTRSLDAAGVGLLAPLLDGRLARPWRGPVVLDGNAGEALLRRFAQAEALSGADLRIVPASPGKAARLRWALGHPSAVLYLNRDEAAILLRRPLASAPHAAEALLRAGAVRAVVTDGANPAADGGPEGVAVSAPARAVRVVRRLGAGDVFMAAHIAAEAGGRRGGEALAAAMAAAADHVAGLA